VKSLKDTNYIISQDESNEIPKEYGLIGKGSFVKFIRFI